MTKIAIFVEGQTERKFARKLIGQRYTDVPFKVNEIERRGKNTFISIPEPETSLGLDCSFWLIEVPHRDTLVSYIRDSATNMVVKRGFSLILGLQDLYPDKRSNKTKIINSIKIVLARSPVSDKISIILAVMETEAWFLCDWHMFERIDARLTSGYIQSHLGLDIVNDDPELAYNHPSKILDSILRLVQRRYRKHSSEIDIVVGNIDFGYLFSSISKIDSFFRFIRELDRYVPAP